MITAENISLLLTSPGHPYPYTYSSPNLQTHNYYYESDTKNNC